MADILGNRFTTASITVGGAVTGSLETIGDHDWFRLDLAAGQAITVALAGLTLEDAYLRIYDSAGTLLYENDDGGPGRDSLLSFTASYSGTYFVDVGAWNEGYAGDYQLSVSPYAPPAVWTNDQIANQLTTGYWDGQTHHFNVSPGGTLTVNIQALTSAGQNLAREALNLWSDIIGVTFQFVTTGGQIIFDDNEQGAHADASWSGTITTSAHVNVSTEWLTNYGTGLNSYAFQTYIHEIGHALGLGHAGNYNGSASYSTDILYQNDGWPATVMSYFDQSENSYFAGLGFTEQFVLSPMTADIVAMAQLYGLSTTTRAGDTVYGFSNTANRSIYDATIFTAPSYTVFDSGGIDTLNYSGFAASQRIDLTPEAFSNVGGRVGNVSIARGTIIENAIGGSGSDVIIGNSASNVLSGGLGADSLTGGGGNDTFRDTAAGLNGDTITDFSAGDGIVFSNATLAGFTFSLSGSTLTYAGGALTLSGFTGQLSATNATGGGVHLSVAAAAALAADARNDFNGDGRSDILWRHDNGHLTEWLGTLTGGFADNGVNAFRSISTSWSVAGTGDFNGDGRDDILWRHDNGNLTGWLGTASGGFVDNGVNAFATIQTSWSVAGIGDFNGDGRDDILWRHDNGHLTEWLGTATGGFSDNGANAFAAIHTSWSVAGIGDFNGDGRDDILWRHSEGHLTQWLGTATGGFTDNGANAFASIQNSWSVAGIGDFNGDGRDDILWRHDNGNLTEWLGTLSGGFVDNGANAFASIHTSWSVAGTGDFNGDGRDDILWRHDNGNLTEWLGTATGGFADNGANAFRSISTAWTVQPESHSAAVTSQTLSAAAEAQEVDGLDKIGPLLGEDLSGTELVDSVIDAWAPAGSGGQGLESLASFESGVEAASWASGGSVGHMLFDTLALQLHQDATV